GQFAVVDGYELSGLPIVVDHDARARKARRRRARNATDVFGFLVGILALQQLSYGPNVAIVGAPGKRGEAEGEREDRADQACRQLRKTHLGPPWCKRRPGRGKLLARSIHITDAA